MSNPHRTTHELCRTLAGSPFDILVTKLDIQFGELVKIKSTEVVIGNIPTFNVQFSLDWMAYRYHDPNKQIMEFMRNYRDAKCACKSVTMLTSANRGLMIEAVFEAFDQHKISVNVENRISSQFLDGRWEGDATERYYDIASEPYDQSIPSMAKAKAKVIVSKARTGRNENLF